MQNPPLARLPRQGWQSRVRLGALLVVAGALLALLEPAWPALATSPPAKLYGKVTAIQLNRHSAIKSFDLLHGHKTFAYRVTSSTRFVPRSSSADIQGFVVGDYAYVQAASGRANEVEFDDGPFKPAPVETYQGVIVKLGSHGLLVVQVASGARRKSYRTKSTTYYLNNQPVDGTLTLQRGETVEVSAEKPAKRWLDISIDLLTSSADRSRSHDRS